MADQYDNAQLEKAVSGLAGATPYAGPAMSALIDIFWPVSASDPHEYWNLIKQFIKDLIDEIISEEKAKALELRLQGIHNNLTDYQNTSFGVPQKGQWFTNVLSSIDDAEPFFFEQENPEKTLTYFVSMGTLKLVVLREQYLFYDKIYQVPDPDRDKHLQTLQKTIKQYTDAAYTAKDNAIKWRLGLIEINHGTRTDFGLLGPSTTHIWTVKDKHVANKLDPHIDLELSWEWNTLTGGNGNAEAIANNVYSNHKSQVEAELGAKLDSFLSPAYQWCYLDPTSTGTPHKTPQKTPVDFNSGPFAGLRGDAFQDNSNDQPITKVIIHAGSRVDGVEFFYGGISGGLHGGEGGQPNVLDLNDGENIVAAWGREGDSMDALYFKTNKDRVVGGGGGGGRPWSAVPPEGTNAILRYISGIQGSRSLEGITLTWRYWVNK